MTEWKPIEPPKKTTPQYSIKLRCGVGELLNQWIAEYRHIEGVHLNKSNAIMKLIKYFVDNEKETPLSNWQPIETAPMDGTRVLLFSPRYLIKGHIKDVPTIETDFYRTIENGNTYVGWGRFNEHLYMPTHWMHLPQVP